MAKTAGCFEIALDDRPEQQRLTSWLYAELRRAILEGRLRAGTKLPASRDFARQHGISRGTAVSVFERLQAEGYVSCRVGSGTVVNLVQDFRPVRVGSAKRPGYIRRAIADYARPKPFVGLVSSGCSRPFRMGEPAVAEFLTELWAGLVARRARNHAAWMRTEDDGRGYRPLREGIADYLAAHRGVRCSPEQVIVVSGAQQALDLLARLLLKKGEAVWVEDPGYFGATIAFGNAGAKIVPVPVDEQGLSVLAGVRASPHAKGVYVTPGHQFPLGMTMSLTRRMALLKWAVREGAFVIEDDYDSEYRFEGVPVPALQSLDEASSVIFIGSFSKVLFPALRIGYVVLPQQLVDYFLAFRQRTEFRNLSFDQVVLCDFIASGHLGRHLRRMRELYATRLGALVDGAKRNLSGLLEISDVRAGLYTAGFLRNGMGSREAESAAAAAGVDLLALDRFTLKRPDPRGLLLGFAAFDPAEIRSGLVRLATALGG